MTIKQRTKLIMDYLVSKGYAKTRARRFAKKYPHLWKSDIDWAISRRMA
jgi:hypothetical protein